MPISFANRIERKLAKLDGVTATVDYASSDPALGLTSDIAV